MKAAVRIKYGPPETLKIQDLPKPVPGDDELLIRIHTATVSRTDCHNLTGKPWIMPLVLGFPKPRLSITGTDFAGQVEAIGNHVDQFKAGDRVMGFKFEGLQSHAEYLTIAHTKDLIPIPDSLNYDQAVTCIEGAFYAINGINKIKPQPGQSALVIGATGAIGSAYVQFLRNAGTTVTAICKGEHSELVKALGAEKIIDYTKEDFTKITEKYDMIIDAVDKSSFPKCKHLLKEKGIFSSSGGFINMFYALTTGIIGGKKVLFIPPTKVKKNLAVIADLAANGKFQAVIDRVYPLEEIAEAFRYVINGEKVGNVLLRFDK